jgi:hypothetical protein
MPKRSRAEISAVEQEFKEAERDVKTFERCHRHRYNPAPSLKRHKLKFGKFKGKWLGALVRGGEHVYYLRWIIDTLDGESEKWAKPYYAAQDHLDAYDEWLQAEYQAERTRVIREGLFGPVPVTDLYNIIASYLK